MLVGTVFPWSMVERCGWAGTSAGETGVGVGVGAGVEGELFAVGTVGAAGGALVATGAAAGMDGDAVGGLAAIVSGMGSSGMTTGQGMALTV